VLPPTAGTILDMGSTLTHKTIVMDLALQGLSTQQISRRIYHTSEAVDQYLRTFDRVLMLRHCQLPKSAICRVTGTQPANHRRTPGAGRKALRYPGGVDGLPGEPGS
jgi:hypothetical protein